MEAMDSANFSMKELEYMPELDAMLSGKSQEADKNLVVKFFMHFVHDQEESDKVGRPKFRDVPFIEMRVRGDRMNIVCRPVRETDKIRFRSLWRAFEDQKESPLEGTPLTEWSSMSRSMIEELKYMGFQTVEQLAEASDSVCSKFAGLANWKNKAKLYMEYALKSAPIDRLETKLSDEANKREALEQQNTQLAARIDQLVAQVDILSKQKATA